VTAPTAPAPDIPEPLAALVDRSRRIGADPRLVLHGGGNTSAKGTLTDHLGREQQVLWVKGSGSDMGTSVARDYPALRLAELTALADVEEMTDEEMVAYVARALVDPTSPRPSIETPSARSPTTPRAGGWSPRCWARATPTSTG
jgi:rhamnose utilization protein RhaD (predicted bifunctional aldolase and dehydrogenase)